MLVLLPPSEGKALPTAGRPVDLTELTFPELTRTRRQLMTQLGRLCRGDRAAARSALRLGPSQDGVLSHNRAVARTPAIPASRLYNGVLHEALDFDSLPAAARRRAARQVLVFSGLWGAVRLTDRLPHYKLPIGAAMGTPLAPLWRRELAKPVAEMAGGGLVVDLRSAPYAAAWRPSAELAPRTVVVTVLAERMVAARLVVGPVSHFNKAAKGRLARELLRRPTDDPADLVDRAVAAGLRGELVRSAGATRLELVEPWTPS